MPIPNSKYELIDAINVNFTRLYGDFLTVPKGCAEDQTLDGHAKGTSMSVHDLASYLLGWNKLVLKWIEKDANGEPIDFPETGYNWNELGALAQKFYGDYASLPFHEVLAALKDAKEEIVAFIEATPDTKLYGEPWYKSYTLGRMIQLNTSSPYANARSRLRKWKRENGLL